MKDQTEDVALVPRFLLTTEHIISEFRLQDLLFDWGSRCQKLWRDPSLSGRKCRLYKPYNRYKQLKTFHSILFANEDPETE